MKKRYGVVLFEHQNTNIVCDTIDVHLYLFLLLFIFYNIQTL